MAAVLAAVVDKAEQFDRDLPAGLPDGTGSFLGVEARSAYDAADQAQSLGCITSRHIALRLLSEAMTKMDSSGLREWLIRTMAFLLMWAARIEKTGTPIPQSTEDGN